MLHRRKFVKQLLFERGDLLVICGLGTPTYDVAAADDDDGSNFYLWGAMGSASMVGLGLALAQPDRRIAVFTGDGEMLMGLGSLATIGVKQPPNLAIVVLDNQHYGETGMQPSHTHSGISLVDVALGCCFKQARSFGEAEETPLAREMLYSRPGPLFIHAHVSTQELEQVLPERDGVILVRSFTERLGASMKQS
jgi:thiamine pyrophosphate-dependent acetolactate synthase large subunit-like protein